MESNFVTAPPRRKGWPLFPRQPASYYTVVRYHPPSICMRPLGRRLLSFSTLFGRKPNPMEARPSANRKSDYELTCRCFFRVYYAPYNATLALESSHPGLPPWGRLQLSRLLFRNPPRILSPSPAGRGDGRVKFRLFFNLLPCVEFSGSARKRLICHPESSF